MGTHEDQNLLGLVGKRHWKSLEWNGELIGLDNEQRFKAPSHEYQNPSDLSPEVGSDSDS